MVGVPLTQKKEVALKWKGLGNAVFDFHVIQFVFQDFWRRLFFFKRTIPFQSWRILWHLTVAAIPRYGLSLETSNESEDVQVLWISAPPDGCSWHVVPSKSWTWHDHWTISLNIKCCVSHETSSPLAG